MKKTLNINVTHEFFEMICNKYKYIDNPSEKVQLNAVSQDLEAIKQIKNPCKEAKNFVEVSKIHNE